MEGADGEGDVLGAAALYEVLFGVFGAAPSPRYLFERLDYYCVDKDSRPDALVFNRTVTLKDTWTKIVDFRTLPLLPARLCYRSNSCP